MKLLTMRWKVVPSKNPERASFLKFSIVFGAASFQNSTTISPSLVLMTATSLDAFMGDSFFSSAHSAVVPKVRLISSQTKIENLIRTCGTNHRDCHARFVIPSPAVAGRNLSLLIRRGSLHWQRDSKRCLPV